MNIYIPIDPSWSHSFLTKHKKIIAEYDFFTFYERFTTTALNYVTAILNFRFDQSSITYAEQTSYVGRLCEDYPLLGHLIPAACKELYRIHVDALVAVPGLITNYQIINNDDLSNLTGVIFVVDNRSI